jgi:CO dehydrogenase maturation factor
MRNLTSKIANSTKPKKVTGPVERGGRIIVSTGRGGTGKSTFSALLGRYLDGPLLFLDIDPDESLAGMLGVDIETVKINTDTGREVPVKTLSDLTIDIEEKDALIELGGGPPKMKISLLLQWYSTYRSDKFDLISLGPRWTEGDYRSANFLFEFILPSIGENYRNIVIDSPAGLEHLNRRVISNINDFFLILDPSAKSIKHIERVKRITKEVRIRYEHLYIIGNYECDDDAEQIFRSIGGAYLGKIEFDANVKQSNLRGHSLLELPATSPACVSIKKLLTKAGLLN